MSGIEIVRIHVDVKGKSVVVEARKVDDAGNVLPGIFRETLPASRALLTHVDDAIAPAVAKAIDALDPLTPPHYVTSALHRVREARVAHDAERAAMAKTAERHEKMRAELGEMIEKAGPLAEAIAAGEAAIAAVAEPRQS